MSYSDVVPLLRAFASEDFVLSLASVPGMASGGVTAAPDSVVVQRLSYPLPYDGFFVEVYYHAGRVVWVSVETEYLAGGRPLGRSEALRVLGAATTH